MKKVLGVIVAMGLMVSPAFADSIHIGNTTNNTTNNQGGQGGAGGVGIGGNASANSTNVNVNSNTQGQSQNQGQHQGQSQVGVNVQGQKQDASNQGVSQSVKFESSMIPGVAVAPGLAAGGSQVCLGSFSVGLSGPMAGVAFGKTVVDKGCEDRQNAILLYNMGYRAEALELIKAGNDRVRGLFTVAISDTKLKVSTVLGSEAPVHVSIPEAMAATQAEAVKGVEGGQ